MKKRLLMLLAMLTLAVGLMTVSAAAADIKVWYRSSSATVSDAQASTLYWTYDGTTSQWSSSETSSSSWLFKSEVTANVSCKITISENTELKYIDAYSTALPSVEIVMEKDAKLTGEEKAIYAKDQNLTITMKGNNVISATGDAISIQANPAPSLTINMTAAEGETNTISGGSAAIDIVGDDGVSKTRTINMTSSGTGVNVITASSGTAVKVGSNASTSNTNLTVNVSGGNNSIKATGSGSAIAAGAGAITITGNASGKLALQGSGGNNSTANYGAAIYTNSGAVSFSGPTVEVSGTYYGVIADSVTVSGGSVAVVEHTNGNVPRYDGVSCDNLAVSGFAVLTAKGRRWGVDSNTITVSDNSQLIADATGSSSDDNSAGIKMRSTGSLTVSGSATVTATGNGFGIDQTTGEINIQGGSVTATASGDNGVGVETSGDVTVSGGSLEATGGANGTGISSGSANYTPDVTVSGGSLTATASGDNGVGLSATGDVTVSSGSLTATGGTNGSDLTANSLSVAVGTTLTATNGNIDAPIAVAAGGSYDGPDGYTYKNESTTGIALDIGDDTVAVILDNGESVSIDKTENASDTAVTYTAGSSGATFSVGSNGTITVSAGSVTYTEGNAIYTIDSNGKSLTGGSLTLGEGETVVIGGVTYTAAAANTAVAVNGGTINVSAGSLSYTEGSATYTIDSNGKSLTSGTVTLAASETITVNGVDVTGPATVTVATEGGSATVTANENAQAGAVIAKSAGTVLTISSDDSTTPGTVALQSGTVSSQNKVNLTNGMSATSNNGTITVAGNILTVASPGAAKIYDASGDEIVTVPQSATVAYDMTARTATLTGGSVSATIPVAAGGVTFTPDSSASTKYGVSMNGSTLELGAVLNGSVTAKAGNDSAGVTLDAPGQTKYTVEGTAYTITSVDMSTNAALTFSTTDGINITVAAGSSTTTVEFVPDMNGSTTGTLTAAGKKVSAGNASSGSSSGGGAAAKNEPRTGESGGWNEIQAELASLVDAIDSGTAKPGETITVKMNGATEVPAEVLSEIAGKDATVEFDMGGGVVWTVNGRSIPAGIGDLNLGVRTGGNSIPVNVINAITGETDAMQFDLAHDGLFGATLRLSLDLGEENHGYWANLYCYDGEALRFQYASRIDETGRASWPFDHAGGSYAVIIDVGSHDPEWVNPFTDVKESDWFYEAVMYVNQNGLMGSVSTAESIFSPNGLTTRAQIATILHRLAGTPASSAANPFTDVPDGEWYTDAVVWATESGIVDGYGGGLYGPDDPITREQLATMLWRYAGNPAPAGTALNFADADEASDWAVEALIWAEENSIMQGYNNMLNPKGNATRAHVAQMLMRYCTLDEST